MASANVKAAPLAFTFAGQSLWTNAPAGEDDPEVQLIDTYHPTAVRYSLCVGGLAWLQLIAMTREMAQSAKAALATFLMMNGGTTDYVVGRTGAQCYADQVTYAEAWRSAGGGYVIGSTTTPSTEITGGNETRRQDGNALVLADASQAFDAVADVASLPILLDPSGAGYDDGTHLSQAGTLAFIAEFERAYQTVV